MRNCPICNIIIYDYIHSLNLSLIDDFKILNNKLNVFFCNQCKFYYSDSNNTNEDYILYYSEYNDYKQQNYCLDKDITCFNFLSNNIKSYDIKNILDYGSGNGKLAELLSKDYNVDIFDIGMNNPNNKYDCLLLSHVLEHIYDLDSFITNISKYINNNGILYIEVPNADFYDKISDICPLQEINIEHINFFSKYALNKLLTKHMYYCINLQDDYFTLKNQKYYVIRGIFKKYDDNKSFLTYLNNGITLLNNVNYDFLHGLNIYVYGCGQFLFKVFDNINKKCGIINIIDDNSCYLNKKIYNKEIINFDKYKFVAKDGDIILLTTLIHDDKIKEKLYTIDKKIKIIDFKQLMVI